MVFPGPSGEPSEGEIAEARDLFVEGTGHAEAERWADALDAFVECYALSGVPAALFNASSTLRSIGRYLDARDSVDQLFREHPELDESLRGAATELRSEVEDRIATLVVRDLPVDPGLILRLDGSTRPDIGDRPLSLEMDAGPHNLQVELPGYELFLWEGELGEGDRTSVQVTLTEIEEGGSGLRTVLWVTLGLVVAGGLAVGAYFLFRPEPLEPQSMFTVEL